MNKLSKTSDLTSKRVVTLLSGGMDSVTLLYQLLREGKEVKCISINYGQRHSKELEAARKVASGLKLVHEIVDLRSITHLLGGSSQTDSSVDVPIGHYAEESMKKTVVPNRNMLMLSIAVAWAISSKCDMVAYACHAGDHTIYPDCRPEFVSGLGKAIELCDWHKVKLITPFLYLTKGDIARIGEGLGVPYQDTWTCYKGLEYHCGECGACNERKEAFQIAGAEDPTRYFTNHKIEK